MPLLIIFRRFLLLILATLCTSANIAWSSQVNYFDWPTKIIWEPKFIGIELASITLKQPRPLKIKILRIDLTAKGISLCTNDDNGEIPEETYGLYTSSFLMKKKCQAAINGAPFWPGRAEENLGQNVVGLTISEGKIISPIDQDKPRSALVFRKGVASIENPPIDLADIETAVGGFGVVVRNGKLHQDQSTPLDVFEGIHPRSAVAIANKGKILFLVVVDGRQPDYSEGVTLDELGDLLLLMGVDDGLNLDGGGTSTMVLEGLDKKPLLVNRPINDKIIGKERVAASHLGILAKPLPDGE